MTLADIIAKLNLTILTAPNNLEAITPDGGYVSDLLSCVVAGAQPGNIWVTLQAHMNVVAVAIPAVLVAATFKQETRQPFHPMAS